MATYYWVGGAGTWSATGNTQFAISSGGVATVLDPTAVDTVIFDANSGTGTCTTASGAVCAALNHGGTNITISLGANLTMGSSFNLLAGVMTLNNYTLTATFFIVNSATTARSVNFGTGNITLTGNAATVVNGSVVTGFTYTGTPTVNLTYAGATGTRTIAWGTSGSEANCLDFYIKAGTDIVAFSGSYYGTVDFTGFSGTLTNTQMLIYRNFVYSATMTVNAGTNQHYFWATTGTQKLTTNGKTLGFPITLGQAGTSATFQLQDNLTMGSTRTFTLTNGTLDLNNLTLSTGLFSSSNSNTRSIAFGTGNITITQNNATVWSMGTATNFSYTGTPTVNLTYAGSTGTRTILSASTAGASETTVPSFNITAGSDIVTMISAFKNVNFTGFTGTLTNALMTFYGNLTFSSGMTMAAANNLKVFSATSGTQQITTNGLTINSPISKNGAGTIQFQDALTQNAAYAFTFSAGTTQLKAGVTSTVGSFVTSGTTQKYLQSTVAGSQATLSQASGTVGTSYLTIQDIYATGGATWNAFYANNNVDAGNNTNWNFGGTPSYDAEYGYKLRSFTERGRF